MQPSRSLVTLLLGVLLAGCGGNAPPPAAPAGPTAGASAEAVARIGDISVHVSAVQTSLLSESVARQYDIARDPNTVLLLVAPRKGEAEDAPAGAARVSATATDLRGARQDIPLHAVEVAGLTDYIGTVTTSLPDTLRFDVRIALENGATSSVQLSRDFYPQ
jgi:hypothetical protein